MSKILITGANSYLGLFAIRHFLEHTGHSIVAVASQRAQPNTLPQDARLLWLGADLGAPLDLQLRTQIDEADRVFHFAWTRMGSDDHVAQINSAMINNLLGAMHDPARFWFVSSVSASPKPFSTYGKTKYACSKLVESLGGSTLVCGLVVEQTPIRGPYRMLRNLVGKLPLSLRAGTGEPLVFPVYIDDIGRVLTTIAALELAPATYRMFSTPVRFNRFMALLEELQPKPRLPLSFSASSAIAMANLGKRMHFLPVKICDQVMTFLYKDDAFLLSHKEIPNVHIRTCENVGFFLSSR